MKLSEYAKQCGVTSRTAFRWWQNGQIKGFRLEDSCAARGYHVGRMVTEIGSGVNDRRRKFLALLADPKADRMVVEQQDRAARVGFRALEVLLSQTGRATRVANLAERDREDLLQDRSSLLNILCASLYGPPRAKQQQQRMRTILANDETQREAEL